MADILRIFIIFYNAKYISRISYGLCRWESWQSLEFGYINENPVQTDEQEFPKSITVLKVTNRPSRSRVTRTSSVPSRYIFCAKRKSSTSTPDWVYYTKMISTHQQQICFGQLENLLVTILIKSYYISHNQQYGGTNLSS